MHYVDSREMGRNVIAKASWQGALNRKVTMTIYLFIRSFSGGEVVALASGREVIGLAPCLGLCTAILR